MIVSILRDWSSVLIVGLNLLVLVIIKFNDLKHIADYVQEMKVNIENIRCKLVEYEGRISKLEGKLNGK